MLAIRMQRTGRKGHAMFRIVVQESRYTPKSGKVVALLGSYDPHTKNVSLAKDKAELFLKNGAQPSDRVATLLEAQGVALPSWYKKPVQKSRALKNADKLRKNQPKEEASDTVEAPEEAAETPAEA